jgi:hypothetical protein
VTAEENNESATIKTSRQTKKREKYSKTIKNRVVVLDQMAN